MKRLITLLAIIALNLSVQNRIFAQNPDEKVPLSVKKCADFSITGNGNNAEWTKASWNELIKLDKGGADYKSKFKIMYSWNGIYILFNAEDNKIATKYDKDFDNLFLGDVFEVFFHPEPKTPVYFEYEINQMNKELVLIIPNLNGRVQGWTPWHYENERKVVKNISLSGGKMELGSAIRSWSAELFFPYKLFSPLSNVPPVSGTIWNANFCRLDYDTGVMVKWAWAPINKSFHEFEKYQPIKFE